MKNNYIWTSIFTAIGASLCCITPILALISGTSGVISTFSCLEPLRPYLIAITILVLGFAWYQKLKPKNKIECNCEINEKPKFLQTKLFLGLVTGFAIIMLAFPYYNNIFYPSSNKVTLKVEQINIQKIELNISGMTCNSCQNHINHAINELPGIISVNTSYQNAKTIIEFDKMKISLGKIEKNINSTGYTVVK